MVFWHGFWHGRLVMRSDGRNDGPSMPSTPAWLCHPGRAVPAVMEHRCGSGRPPVADRPLAGRYHREWSGGLLRL